MATPSQTPETPAASTISEKTAISPDSTVSDNNKTKVVTTVVNKAHLASDLCMLESGSFSDFAVICGKQQWKTHRVILSRCPYFKAMFSEHNAFQENVNSSITINDFEPFEIDWLLRYIYGLHIEFQKFQETSPHKSYLETCAILWSLADFFCLSDVCQLVMKHLSDRCRKLFIQSRSIEATIDEISFLPDLEAAIHAAWRPDRIAGPVREQLMTVCTGLHPVLRDQTSFMRLLEEVPEFAHDFLKALLGCAGLQKDLNGPPRPKCRQCKSTVLETTQGEEKKFVKGALIWTPLSLHIYNEPRSIYCSRECYNKVRAVSLQYPEQP